ncbi:5-methylcytosine-specific restriction protein A [Actinomadura coerulea]|uniref:5-methylcytosine-specific restriction protein A n=1 Tax=Actinomadura coerulea TaxID=46159 RepID=A0A7X0L1U9_9ACTN|nr:holin [Actinomadura coerulea]MBB6398910.1 5-methylcytosine-specific restriction protein A [Actinomadura coerulea]GGP98322.1 hypothetical protein GCM10010187_12420 [Actinomadura coerulea]
MPRRGGLRPCPTPGCPELTRGGRCEDCKHEADQRRGSSSERGYGRRHRERFRTRVLAKHPVCQVCRQAPATEADHHPIDRRTLELRGLDPDDPVYGRGLCKPCHSRETAKHQPGGWHADQQQ